ncbi:MAG: complex I NDUFA9 subunit family protein [Sphingomonadaceae bacterium]|nr:complex I NDUFA9 subunit family protein [Sphingomonadaceae bacterium]
MKDRLVTVFGGGGFLGRYAVQALLAAGARVRIAARDPRDAWYLKPLGGLGQTQFVAADIRKPATVARAIAGSDAAVNLVGILKGDFNAFHVDGARNVAEAATKAGVGAFVHISAIGADAASPSAYGRSKAEGEAGVRATFPTATILRPSVVFGREDAFVNRFARLIRALPVLPVVRGSAKLQPVYVGDVAKAIVAALGREGGGSFELGGPEVFTMTALNRWIARAIGRDPAIVEVPDGLSRLMASATGWLPGAPITRDQWLMLARDNVAIEDGLAALGIAATPLEAVTEGWLIKYRRHGRFAKAADTSLAHPAPG